MGSKTSFGSWLKQRRKTLDLTQDDLARRAGCAVSTIRKIEQDQRRPSRQVAELLLACLGVAPAEQEILIRLARAQFFPEYIDSIEAPYLPDDALMSALSRQYPSKNMAAPKQEESVTSVGVMDQVANIPSPGNLNNLPIPPTSFVGWAIEIEQVRNLLIRPDVRLVTLIGPGGAGKTRLGLEIASQLVQEFRHGVYFVALGPIHDSSLVETTIAQALGVKEGDGVPLVESLLAYLKNKHILLVLDNFEQVLKAASLVSELLEFAPHLKILVTSRAVLRLYGEHEFEVPPLAVPDLRHLPTLPELAQAPAVALFIARARAVQPNFALTQQNAAAVAELCVRLDGLPLAIELAAARTKLFSPQDITARLSNRLALLTDGAQDLPQRQQTMRNTMDWSYDLLTPNEKSMFTRLGVFVGGCTLDAVEMIAGTPMVSALGLQTDVNPLDQLSSLLDKSMLVRQISGEEIRFNMLETIHEYACEHLDNYEEAELLRQRHTAYYLRLAEAAQPELNGSQSQIWLDRLEREHDNLRAALRWALGHEAQTETALRLATVMGRFWRQRGYLGEGRRWLEAALTQSKTQPAVARAWAFRESASLALGQGDYDQAREFLESAQDLWGDLRDKPFVTWLLGVILDAQGKYDEAQIFLKTNLAFHRQAGNKENVAHALHLLGQSAMKKGEYDEACAWLEESLTIRRKLQVKEDIALSLLTLGHTMRLGGNLVQACKHYEESLAVFESLGEKWGIAHCFLNLGKIACSQAEFLQAHKSLMAALKIFQELGDHHGLVYSLEAQGSLAGFQKQPQRAARLWGAAAALREAMGTPLPPADNRQLETDIKNVEAYLAACGESEVQFLAAWQAGQEMSEEEAVAFALNGE